MNLKVCCESQREVLSFLLRKTAAVRDGIKPGELLRVRSCYHDPSLPGRGGCLMREEIFSLLALAYRELKSADDHSLVLFYHPRFLQRTLRQADNRELLCRCGYPEVMSVDDALDRLQQRFGREKMPHEVGVFIGYPAKDVEGFIRRLPRTPVERGSWAVFGDASESLRCMRRYRQAEFRTMQVLDDCKSLQLFLEKIQFQTKENSRCR